MGISALIKTQDAAEGAVRIIIFLIFLMLAFWGINMYRHIKSKKWTAFQKIVDILGVIFFIGIAVALVVPLIRG